MSNQQNSDLLLIGHPNVGKSVLFSRLTGVRTIASNYPGTTVTFTAGKMRAGDRDFVVVDAPGTYSLDPLDEAASVAVEFALKAKRIIHVIDSTHLERHLPLTLELAGLRKPLLVALNMSDEARHCGISIDSAKLSKALGLPVVPIVARSGEGIRELIDKCISLPSETDSGANTSESQDRISGANLVHPERAHGNHQTRDSIWRRVGELVEEAQTLKHHHHSFAERLEEITIHPVFGGFFALLVMALSLSLIRLIGEFFISGAIGIFGDPWLELPFGTELLFEKAIKPLLAIVSTALGSDSVLHTIIIGALVEGEIDFMQSFGILTSGIFIPLGVVFPYLISFYFVLSLLEDAGYLPRLAVFLDSAMHRVGLHGYAIIPILLGMGCNVPGIMATRILEGRYQRFVSATLISIAVPCTALQAMIIGLVGNQGLGPLVLVYGILFVTWLMISLILRFAAPGFRPELLVEIPRYRLPTLRALLPKLWMRISAFLREALPIILGVILVVNILFLLKVMDFLARISEPVITWLWGMPKEAVVPLIIGILRKDIALGMLAPLPLTGKQLIIGSVLMTMFFPCVATLVVLFRELGIKDGLKSLAVMLIAVFAIGALLNLIL